MRESVRLPILLGLALCAVACQSSDPNSTTPGASAGTASGGGGGGDAGGGSSSVSGSGGASGGSVAGGVATGGTSAAGGGAGSGGVSGGGASQAGSGGAMGGSAGAGGYQGADKLTCNPGTDGDGKHDFTGGDPPEWTLGAGVTPGMLTPKASFASTTYNEHFPYQVYTSANYVQGKPAVFMFFGDGISNYLSDFHAATVLDNLEAAGDIPPAVVLFIDPPSDGDRVQTYDPPSSKYGDFLFNEFFPQVILPSYSVSKDPDAWATGGYSASGGADFTVLWKHPDNIHKFIGANTSFGASIYYNHQGEYVMDSGDDHVVWADEIMNAPPHVIRASLVTSTNDLADARGKWIDINTAVANALAAKGDQWRLMIGTGPHYPPSDSPRDFPEALRWTWRGCQFAP